ncbi:hypothetical protein HHK36_031372 [Tetracentron sinense]|uniref:Protein kinase domain-containing protein n=1 Tax=Tetracentron sinense TaxID=13715 RepID=A0A835D2H0_TETSI|nr:hypothetical protein HHK36_031372 [Tetracentron sinense]
MGHIKRDCPELLKKLMDGGKGCVFAITQEEAKEYEDVIEGIHAASCAALDTYVRGAGSKVHINSRSSELDYFLDGSKAGMDTLVQSEPLVVLRRTLEIFIGLGTFAFQLLLDERNGQLDRNKRMRAAQLRMVFTRLGPTFVKLGQGLSTRPDICPPEYLEELSELQDALPTFPDVEAFSCIERELELPLDSIYSSISPSPIAAASLGQVYKARLKYSGQVVAVKVQRPGIEEAIGLDFYLIRGVGFLVNKYVDIISSDVVALIDEFARREGKNARRFKKLYADKEDVLVPDIFWDYTSGKVLTMEWVDGVKLNEQEAIEGQGLKVLDLVNTGIQCSLRQLLEYGYFHADPHPGNLLATPEGKLAFLDFGMMSETPEEARFAIIGHVVHMVNRDYEAMARDYYALDFLSPDVDVSPIVPALRSFFDDALNSTVSELNFKTIVDGLGAVLYQYPFNVPAYYALILRSLTVLEGLALYADPNFKVLAASYPYFAKRLLTDPNPYLRDALIELLFKDGRFRQVYVVLCLWWNRLENLLVQGRKDRDFSAKDALQPVLKLLLADFGTLNRHYLSQGFKYRQNMLLGLSCMDMAMEEHRRNFTEVTELREINLQLRSRINLDLSHLESYELSPPSSNSACFEEVTPGWDSDNLEAPFEEDEVLRAIRVINSTFGRFPPVNRQQGLILIIFFGYRILSSWSFKNLKRVI